MQWAQRPSSPEKGLAARRKVQDLGGSEEKTPPKWMGLGSAVGALGYGERVKGQRGPKERSRGGAGGWGSPGNEIQRLGRPRRLPRAPPGPVARAPTFRALPALAHGGCGNIARGGGGGGSRKERRGRVSTGGRTRGRGRRAGGGH